MHAPISQGKGNRKTTKAGGGLRPANYTVNSLNQYILRESLLMGPNGGLKVQSIWEGDRLITVILHGGGR